MEKHYNYNKNVFINCPFDDKYFDILQALVFCITYFGFIPRISLESSDSVKPRLEKIVELIQESRYSIHDLSRLQAESVNEYYRLNMPFELGIDYGLRKFNPNYNDKRALILGTERYEYMKAISDINGFDIKHHDDSPLKLFECLRAWFSETVKVRDLNSSEKVFTDFIEYNKSLFERKLAKYNESHTSTQSERYATKEIEEMTIPEFIEEIKDWKDAQ